MDPSGQWMVSGGTMILTFCSLGPVSCCTGHSALGMEVLLFMLLLFDRFVVWSLSTFIGN